MEEEIDDFDYPNVESYAIEKLKNGKELGWQSNIVIDTRCSRCASNEIGIKHLKN